MTDYRDPNNIDPNGNYTITQLVKFIREKMFGVDVRESIAKALEKAYEDVVGVTDRQTTVEEQFQSVLDEITGKDVISAPELIAARNGKPDLKTRIDDLENETNAQLAQTVNETSQLSNVIVSAEKFGAKTTSNFDSAPAIQAAIDFVAGLGGGEVRLHSGLFRTASKLVLKEGVSLVGAGMNSTRIMILSGTNDHVIEIEGKAWKTGGTYQRIENLTINGNKVSVEGDCHGIYASSSVMYTYINNVEVTNCKGDGLRYVSSHRNILKNVITSYNDGNGITIIDENGEGVGTQTDNHVEMGYITSSRNGGHGFNFINPVDIRCMHLASMVNGGDGYYIKDASGGWCNILDTIVSQGNRNGVNIEGGNSLTINNLSVSVPSEYCLKVTTHLEGIFNNFKLHNGRLGNIYLNGFQQGVINNVISKLGIDTLTNVDMTNTRFNNFSNFRIIKGAHGLHLRNDSSRNNFNNIEVREVLGYGVWLNGSSSVRMNENGFSNVMMRRIGSSDNVYTSAFYVQFSPRTFIRGYRNSEDRATINIDYAIDLSTSEQCVISDSFGRAKIEGFRKHVNNTTSIISDTAMSEVFGS